MQSEKIFQFADERFADLQMLRYQVPGFQDLNLRQQVLAYYLSEAALWGRDILWDQNCRFNLRLRQLLETVYTDFQEERDTHEFKEFCVYLKRVWFSNGIHHHYGSQKFHPGFTSSFLRRAVLSVPASKLPLREGQSAEELCDELFPVIFNPEVCPKRVNQTEGEDLLLTS